MKVEVARADLEYLTAAAAVYTIMQLGYPADRLATLALGYRHQLDEQRALTHAECMGEVAGAIAAVDRVRRLLGWRAP